MLVYPRGLVHALAWGSISELLKMAYQLTMLRNSSLIRSKSDKRNTTASLTKGAYANTANAHSIPRIPTVFLYNYLDFFCVKFEIQIKAQI